MGRLLLSALFLGSAVAVFMLLTQPNMDAAVPVRAERDDFEAALDNAQQIKAERERLSQITNQISQEDEERLNKFLPDHVDNVRLIIEIKDIIESKAGLFLEDINVVEREGGELAQELHKAGFSSTQISFVVRGDYFSFKELMRELELNLRIVDVVSLSTEYNDLDREQIFEVVLRTYWIPKAQSDV